MRQPVLLVGPTKPASWSVNWGAPPLGVHRIAAWLRRHGIATTVYDSALPTPSWEDTLISAPWQLIGFSVLNETLMDDIRAMHQAHIAHPEAMIVAGGVEATLNPGDLLDFAPCDAIALAEGEHQMLALAEGGDPGTIPGMLTRRTHDVSTSDFERFWETVDLGDLCYEDYWRQTAGLYWPVPDCTPSDWDRRGILADDLVEKICTVRLITSSHCNRGCTFCSVTRWHEFACGHISKPKVLSAERVWELVERVKREVPSTRTIYFCEDSFLQDRARALAFFGMTADSDLGLRYLVQAHSREVDEELIGAMAAGHCRHLTLGIENCSLKVLRDLHKPQDLEHVERVIGWCMAAGVVPYLLIILFCPSATVEDLWINVETLERWMALGAQVSIEPNMMVYRGAPLYHSDYEMDYVVRELPKPYARAGRDRLRQPWHIRLADPAAEAVRVEFNRRWPDYLKAAEVSHRFKGETGRLMVALVREILEGNLV